MGRKVSLLGVPVNEIQQGEAGPGDVVSLPEPAETRNYWAIEPGTRIVCIGAEPVKAHPYGKWIAEEASSGGS